MSISYAQNLCMFYKLDNFTNFLNNFSHIYTETSETDQEGI